MKAALGSPAESAGELYFKTDVSPEQFFQAIGRLRREARDEIDRLIRFLDSTDDHMEREPDGSDEPWLGWPEGRGPVGINDDRELDDVDDEDGHDQEQDPAESGIGDFDGLREQDPTQDWQGGSVG